jgi:peptidoglycan/LPS O-acetylase OafA/YrhL
MSLLTIQQTGDSHRPEIKYMSQLDSLRTLATLGVFLAHYLAQGNPIRSGFPWGWLGVRLFFVMSGFLVAGILMSCRRKIDEGSASPWQVMQNFYIRRSLRLFPIYYIYLVFAALMHPGIQDRVVASVFYVQNFLFAYRPLTFNTIAHLWTLAVEIQFYLILPWIIIFFPKRRIVPILLAMIAFSPVLRFIMLDVLHEDFAGQRMNMMMPSHFDTLSLGALLSVLMASGQSGRVLAKRLLSFGLRFGTPLLLAFIIGRNIGISNQILGVFAESGAGLVFIWLVGHASTGFKGVPGAVLNNSVLIYLGQISYGLYMYHIDVPKLFDRYLFSRLGVTAADYDMLLFPIYTAATIAIAVISWKFIEQPINQLKRHFPMT